MGWAPGRTGRKILANTIDLPVALRVLAHLHGEVNPQWHDLAQVVNVQTKEAADLVGVRVGLRLGRRLRVRLRGYLVDPAKGLGAHELRRHSVVDAFEVWAR